MRAVGDTSPQGTCRADLYDHNGLIHAASITETKAKLSALLDLVRQGETVVITDRGRPVARIVPAVESADDDGRIKRLERAGLIRRPKRRLELESFLAEPLPESRASAVEALLEERREGR